MLRRSLRIGLTVGILGGLVLVATKLFGAKPEPQPATGPSPAQPWAPLEPSSTPAPKAAAKPAAKAAAKPPAATAWVEATGDVCPTTHPVKGKLSSKIFHLPGMMNYDRTRPDRCYRDAEAAEADGLRAAKR